jgi:hypothetical protein
MDIQTPDLDACRQYRLYTLYRLPNLVVLDCGDIIADERREAALRGQFAVTRRAKAKTQSEIENAKEEQDQDRFWSTAPQQVVPPSSEARQTSAVLGFNASRYDGRQSEGNRFIADKSL